MHQIVRTIRSSTFLKHNAIFFLGALAAGALNYLFYPIMARLLPTGNFGEVQALVSLFAQINIFLGVLGLLTVNIVVNTSRNTQRDLIIVDLEKCALAVGLALMLVSVLFGGNLKHFFNFDSAWPFVCLMLAVFVSIPLMFRNAYLRGRQAFGLVSLLGILAAGADLVLAVLFVLFHWHTTGVMLGLVAAQLLTFIYSAWLARRAGFGGWRRGTLLRLPDMRVLAPELRYAIVVLVCSLTITGLYSIDTVVVKHWFDVYTAGLYAGIATVARIILFVTGSIAQVLLSAVRMNQTAERNRRVLTQSLVLLVGIGGVTLLAFALLPRLVVQLLMGQRFLPYAGLLPRLSLVIFLVSVINLFMMYHLALRRYAVALFAVCGVAAAAGFLAANHQTPAAVVNDLLYACLVFGGLLGVWSLRVKTQPQLVQEQSEAEL